MTKTSSIALLVSVLQVGAPAALFAEAPAGAAVGAQAASPAITDQEIQLLQQDIKDRRRLIVVANLPLTAEESAKFWPVYDQYVAEVTKILDDRYTLLKGYAANYDALDDGEATAYVSQLFEADKARMELRRKYLPIFQKVLSKMKAAMFLQMDRRIQMMIDIQRIRDIPLINPK